jgi:hypothetical protein
MVNYKNTKIFTIRNKINDKIFVTFTTLKINAGFNGFKRSLKDLKNEITQAFEELGVSNFYYELEEEIECETKDDVNKCVDNYIKKYDSIRNGYNSIKTRKKPIKNTVEISDSSETSDESLKKAMQELDDLEAEMFPEVENPVNNKLKRWKKTWNLNELLVEEQDPVDKALKNWIM